MYATKKKNFKKFAKKQHGIQQVKMKKRNLDADLYGLNEFDKSQESFD